MILLQAAASSDYTLLSILLFGLFCFVIYFLPTIIGRNKNSRNSILVLNFFLGWTFIGWIIALIWAVSPDKNPVIVYDQPQSNNSSSNKTDELLKYKQLLDNGAITQEEFEIQKGKILST